MANVTIGDVYARSPAGPFDGTEVFELEQASLEAAGRLSDLYNWLNGQPYRVPFVAVSASKTLALTDANVEQRFDAAATLTIDTDAVVAVPEGSKVPLLRFTTGAVTIDAVAGVTLNGVDGGSTTISNAYDGAVLTKGPANTWAITGGVEAVA